jgi:lipopolysaccharide heptosyltransferase I
MKILIVKLSSLGDVVHTLSALNALHRGFASARGAGAGDGVGSGKSRASGEGLIIDWLVEENFNSVLTGHPMINEVITVKKGAWLKSPIEAVGVAKKIRSKRYDMVLDFQGLLKSAVWVALSGAGRKVGFANARELSHLVLTEKFLPRDREMHAVDRYLGLAEYAGGDSSQARFPLHCGDDAVRSVDLLLNENGLEPGAFFAVAPTARWKTKHWNAKGFAGVIRLVRERLGMRAALVGSDDDFQELDEIRSMTEGAGAVNLAGRTGLKELTRLLELAKFAVTVDSGPMHLAVAVNTPVVAIFGPTSPVRTGPYGKANVVVRKGLECSPCFKRECDDLKCMDQISPEDVMAAISEVASRPVVRMPGTATKDGKGRRGGKRR